jgi:hypothetical protein
MPLSFGMIPLSPHTKVDSNDIILWNFNHILCSVGSIKLRSLRICTDQHVASKLNMLVRAFGLLDFALLTFITSDIETVTLLYIHTYPN